ncbi:putative urea transporter [Kockovaella imperatae]|uniref:Putative urea transporter n=1 Tax=Kockovaella imperatae TaxID=4999 RepID=A0A1Y1UF71_9TREE|nr:putative urea transporter [Kockovaella imperatae]ORX36710.1 putative urea transporter [Kockovaella imperatae]
MAPILPRGAGYGVVVGMGLVFSLVMVGLSKIQTKYTSHKVTSTEEFTSASRSIPPGLIAAGIVSAWTWAATLLQSSATGYKFGISGPYWYASGATIQILLFAMIASKLKQNAPNCHTFLEIIRARWGKAAHLTFLFFGLATNIIVSTMLILGGSATVTDLTGMNTIAACFLIPLGVSIYVLAGGMRATLIADYSHTLVLYCILISFALVAYATSPIIGSPAKMWEMLKIATENHPVKGNAEGSYLTMRSKSGLIFGVLNIVGNFGTVFNDQAYWQRAIASRPQTSVKAFLLGGVAWFSVPMGIATSLGLAAVVLAHGDNPLITLTSDEVSAGLPAVKAAAALMGQSGGIAMLILLFLAVTSACSAEQIAVSSLLTYDVYGTYVNPHASEKQILRSSQLCILLYSLFMGAIATAFNYIGVSMGYLYELMGCLIGSAVVPIALCITWKKANGTGAIVGAIVGFCAAIAGWIGITAKLNNGVVTVDTTFGDYEMLTGNLLAIGIGGLITVGWSIIRPANFDWEITRAINTVQHGQVDVHSSTPSGAATPTRESKDESGAFTPGEKDGSGLAVATLPVVEDSEEDQDARDLQKAFRFASWSALSLVLILIILIPLPLFFSSYVYPQHGFTAWVSISLIWLFVGLALVGIYPMWEARHGLRDIVNGIWRDLRRK